MSRTVTVTVQSYDTHLDLDIGSTDTTCLSTALFDLKLNQNKKKKCFN